MFREQRRLTFEQLIFLRTSGSYKPASNGGKKVFSLVYPTVLSVVNIIKNCAQVHGHEALLLFLIYLVSTVEEQEGG